MNNLLASVACRRTSFAFRVSDCLARCSSPKNTPWWAARVFVSVGVALSKKPHSPCSIPRPTDLTLLFESTGKAAPTRRPLFADLAHSRSLSTSSPHFVESLLSIPFTRTESGLRLRKTKTRLYASSGEGPSALVAVLPCDFAAYMEGLVGNAEARCPVVLISHVGVHRRLQCISRSDGNFTETRALNGSRRFARNLFERTSGSRGMAGYTKALSINSLQNMLLTTGRRCLQCWGAWRGSGFHYNITVTSGSWVNQPVETDTIDHIA